MIPPTKKQLAVENSILKLTKKRGYGPTIREVAEYLDSTPGAIHSMIVRLEERGRLRRLPGKPRAIEVIA
jgi:SOS-response transcriptional repressor LexA